MALRKQMIAIKCDGVVNGGVSSLSIQLGNVRVEYANGLLMYSRRASEVVVNGVNMLASDEAEDDSEDGEDDSEGEGETSVLDKHRKK